MKYFIVFFVFFSSCKQTKDEPTKSAIDAICCTDNKDIYGSWGMCATSSNNTMIQYNVCKTIHFNTNGTGNVGNETLALESFIWDLKKGVLKIVNNKMDANSLFLDTFYSTYFRQDSIGMSLMISSKKTRSTFYLGK